jgi:hypothetical protein
MEVKTINLKLTGYKCVGDVDVTFWDGERGNIDMKGYTISELTDETIIKGINDGEFGVRSIDRAYVQIYEDYQGYKVLCDEREYTREQLTNCKRGI